MDPSFLILVGSDVRTRSDAKCRALVIGRFDAVLATQYINNKLTYACSSQLYSMNLWTQMLPLVLSNWDEVKQPETLGG